MPPRFIKRSGSDNSAIIVPVVLVALGIPALIAIVYCFISRTRTNCKEMIRGGRRGGGGTIFSTGTRPLGPWPRWPFGRLPRRIWIRRRRPLDIRQPILRPRPVLGHSDRDRGGMRHASPSLPSQMSTNTSMTDYRRHGGRRALPLPPPMGVSHLYPQRRNMSFPGRDRGWPGRRRPYPPDYHRGAYLRRPMHNGGRPPMSSSDGFDGGFRDSRRRWSRPSGNDPFEMNGSPTVDSAEFGGFGGFGSPRFRRDVGLRRQRRGRGFGEREEESLSQLDEPFGGMDSGRDRFGGGRYGISDGGFGDSPSDSPRVKGPWNR